MTETRAPAGGWHTATVRQVVRSTSYGVSLLLDVPGRTDHLPGQHYVVRLRAADGYTAQRSYSIVSSPAEPGLELYVEVLPGGEVSGWLTGVAQPGDTFEVRGPIGGWFVWRGDVPALTIGGGSGVVPTLSMLRRAVELGHPDRLGIAAAARTRAELPYADELLAAGATLALSRETSPSGRAPARLTRDDLAPLVARNPAAVLVCGSAVFAESVTDLLTGLGVLPGAIRVERFGPTG